MAEPIGTTKKHTLVDHLMGDGGVHSHAEGDYDHDHDHDDLGEYDPEHDALWQQDHIQLVSVGIDIGSSGTQVIFSRVYMRRMYTREKITCVPDEPMSMPTETSWMWSASQSASCSGS